MAWTLWTFFIVFSAASAFGIVAGALYWCLPADVATQALASPSLQAVGVVAVFALLAAISARGLAVGRWLHGATSAGLLLVLIWLIARWVQAVAAGKAAPNLDMPPASIETMAIFLKMTVFGLAGLECLALVAGEVERPECALPRSIWFAAPIIGLAYIGATGAVVSATPRGDIDLVNPLAQMLGREAGALAPVALGILLLRDLGQSALTLTANSRLPSQAGLHGVLPAALSHRNRHGAPTFAVLACAGASAVLCLMAAFGALRQEGFQWLLAAAGVLFGLTYLALFALPLSAKARSRLGLPSRLSWPLGLACVAGWTMTLAFVVFAVWPIVDVADPRQYALRIAMTVALLLVPGWLLIWRQRRRQH
jgi:amino acid transporter